MQRAAMKWGSLALAGTLSVTSAPAYAGLWDVLNLPVGVTSLSREAYDLHMLIMWICSVLSSNIYF